MRNEKERKDMFDQNIGLAYKLADKYIKCYPTLQQDDIYQCAFLSLWEATEDFDESTGALLGNWVNYRMMREIKNETRFLYQASIPFYLYVKGERTVENSMDVGADTRETESNMNINPLLNCVSNEFSTEDSSTELFNEKLSADVLELAERILSPREYELLMFWYNTNGEVNLSEWAKKHNKSRNLASHYFRSAIDKLQKHIKETNDITY